MARLATTKVWKDNKIDQGVGHGTDKRDMGISYWKSSMVIIALFGSRHNDMSRLVPPLDARAGWL